MLAVPGLGVRSWTIDERKSSPKDKKWAQCSTSDFYCHHIDWDEDRQVYVANRAAWEQELEEEYEFRTSPRDPQRTVIGTFSKDDFPLDDFMADRRREVRAHICAYLAGHIADGITAGMSATDALRLYDRRDMQRAGKSDIAIAQGLADLLPHGEYDNAVRVTEEALRRPEIWKTVIRVAEQLEQLGLIESDECEIDLFEWLPSAINGWPPATGPASATPPRVITGKVRKADIWAFFDGGDLLLPPEAVFDKRDRAAWSDKARQAWSQFIKKPFDVTKLFVK